MRNGVPRRSSTSSTYAPSKTGGRAHCPTVCKSESNSRAHWWRIRKFCSCEPMAGMTATEKQEMTRFVRAAREEFGTTVILIEHDIGIVMGLSDRVAVLDHGRKIADGPPAEVQANQAVIDAYIGVPHDDEPEEVYA